MSSLKIVILPLVILGTAFFLWFSAKPDFTKARKLVQVDKLNVENQIKEEKELQRRTESLFGEQSELKSQVNPIINALPGNEEIKNLLAQIEFVVQKEGMVLKGVSSVDSGGLASANAVMAGAAAPKDYIEIEGTMDLRGSYNQFKQLLANLEKLDRVINITNISVKNTSGSGETLGGQFSLRFKAYYQDLITAEKIRSALEAKDVAGGGVK